MSASLIPFNRRLLVILHLLATLQLAANATRTRLNVSEEPTSKQIYNSYRYLFSDRNLFNLRFAGVLNESHISDEILYDEPGPDGKFVKPSFDFKSSEIFRQSSSIKWYIPLLEMSALQVYDDPKDMELASAPEVNDQQLCGLHLEYQLHMAKFYANNFDNVTEYTIWSTMNSFDLPKFGMNRGNNAFLGDYQNCIDSKLAVYKRELDLVDKIGSERYFATKAGIEWDEKRSLFREYIGPFVGIAREPKKLYSLEQFSDKLRLLQMRYCMAGIRWPSWPNTTFYKRNEALRVAACLPESCDSKSLEVHGDKIKRLMDFHLNGHYSGYYIENLYCLPDERSPMRNPFNFTNTTLFIAFNITWFSLLIVATIIHWLKEGSESQSEQTVERTETGWWRYLSSWAMIKNFNEFWGNRQKPEASDQQQNGRVEKRVDFEPLEGFKVISSLSVILSHCCMVVFVAVWNQEASHQMLSRSAVAMLHVVCPAVVDNFFVATGLITTRALFKTPRNLLLTAGFWVKFLIFRYVRIVPLYLLVHWFLQAYFRFLNAGPLWDYGTSHSAWSKVCQNESIWTVILPQANLKSPANHCNPVGWYLACDLQFTLMTPFIIILYLKKPFLGHITVVVTSLAVMANHVRYYLVTPGDARGALEWNMLTLTRVTDDYSAGYVSPQYRCVSYLIGLMAGIFLNDYESGKIKRWPRSMLIYGKIFFYSNTYLLCALPFIVSMLPMNDEPLMLKLGSITDGTIHGITSFSTAIFLLLLCTGQLQCISRVFCMSFLKPLAHASLTTVLIHIPILYYHVHSMRTLPELSHYYTVVSFFIWCMESFLLAMVLHVLYELPMRKITMKLMLKIFASEEDLAKLKAHKDKAE